MARGVLCLLSTEYSELMYKAWQETLVTVYFVTVYCYALRLWSQI